MIVFSCPDCGKELRVKEELIGKRRKCPFCQSKVSVPAPEEEGQKTQLRTLKSDAVNSVSRPANLGPAPKTMTGDAAAPKHTQIIDETISPDGAALDDVAGELTRILQPRRSRTSWAGSASIASSRFWAPAGWASSFRPRTRF